MFGGVWAAAETRKVLGALGARTLEDTVAVAKADERLANGVDAALLSELRSVVDALADAVEARAATRRPPRQEALDRAGGVVERVPQHRVPGRDADDLEQVAECSGVVVRADASYGRYDVSPSSEQRRDPNLRRTAGCSRVISP